MLLPWQRFSFPFPFSAPTLSFCNQDEYFFIVKRASLTMFTSSIAATHVRAALAFSPIFFIALFHSDSQLRGHIMHLCLPLRQYPSCTSSQAMLKCPCALSWKSCHPMPVWALNACFTLSVVTSTMNSQTACHQYQHP